MTFVRFASFLDKVDDGTINDSPEYRAYEVEDIATSRRLYAAMDYLDPTLSKDIGIALYQIVAALSALRGPAKRNGELRERLIAWYNWQRIVSGELSAWKLRKRQNCPDLKARSPSGAQDTERS